MHGHSMLTEVEMIEDQDAAQSVVIYDNRGNLAALHASYELHNGVRLAIHASDGVEPEAIALALVNFASGCTEDHVARGLLYRSRDRLLEVCTRMLYQTQNGHPLSEEGHPF